jgi:hypothetical protein
VVELDLHGGTVDVVRDWLAFDLSFGDRSMD